MMFHEMSWKELQDDFKKFLDNVSIEELVESLKKYAINNENYTFKITYENNLIEHPIQESIDRIITEPKQEEVIKDNNTLDINNELYSKMEDAA